MTAAVEAWNTMGWFEGFHFTAWIVALYWGANLKSINGLIAAPFIVLNWRMKMTDTNEKQWTFGMASKTGSLICSQVKQKQFWIHLKTTHPLM